MRYVNIHGQPVDAAIREAAAAERRARYLTMVPTKRKPTVKKGYAAEPGTGPVGKFCKDCAYKTTIDGSARSYVKCLLRKPSWTKGGGTDILANSPACSKFEAA